MVTYLPVLIFSTSQLPSVQPASPVFLPRLPSFVWSWSYCWLQGCPAQSPQRSAPLLVYSSSEMALGLSLTASSSHTLHFLEWPLSFSGFKYYSYVDNSLSAFLSRTSPRCLWASPNHYVRKKLCSPRKLGLLIISIFSQRKMWTYVNLFNLKDQESFWSLILLSHNSHH